MKKILFAVAGGKIPIVPIPEPPTEIPTMTEWGFILFVVLAGAVGLYSLVKRKC